MIEFSIEEIVKYRRQDAAIKREESPLSQPGIPHSKWDAITACVATCSVR
jgi:hypothetical protein